MSKSRIVCLSLIAVLLVSLLPLVVPTRPGAAQTPALLEPELVSRLQVEGSANYFVKMEVDADLSPAEGMDWEARGEFVWRTLNEVARTTQAPVLDYCQENGLDCTSMIVTNSVFVRAGNMTAAQALATLPGVAYLRLERIHQLPDPVAGGAGTNGFLSQGAAPDATTAWGIVDTKADEVWALGYKGAGIKVANIDTGVQWNHPALQGQFACPGQPTNAACWSDPSNICGAGGACDNNGHGTHTMGTMVADDNPALTYIAGMAPDATWIACKGCETNSCSDFALTACASWILAPGGSTANRPHIVNNSWGGGPGDAWYLTYVQSWRAAGILPAFSAGNSGSACNTIGSPGDYQESLASAAHDSGRSIAWFSSRGPSVYGHDPYTKPNISAPGVNICSTVPTDGWSCGYSGTSMASPHTAGAVGLIWQACPAYKGDIDGTFQLLQGNADAAPAGDCGAPPDGQGNYTFGYGYLNALRAVVSCSGPTGTLAGTVRDQDDLPIVGATVTASNGLGDTTDGSGAYKIDLPPGTYSATASHPNYGSSTVGGLVISADTTTVQDFKLSWVGGWVNAGLGSGCPDWTRYDAEYDAGTGQAYLLGGRSGDVTYADVYAFDPATGTCADTGADMPTPISNYTIAALSFLDGNRLCTFGGRDATGAMVLAVQCYSPTLNNVVIKASLPAAFSGYLPGGVEVVDNKAYIFGGFRASSFPYHLAVTYEYNPATNTYAAKGSLVLARGYMLTAVADGKIYAFGGDIYDGLSLAAQTRAERFDPASGTWDDGVVPDLPVASGEGRAFGFNTGSVYSLPGRIVLAGGGQWPGDSAEALTYFPGSQTYDYDFADLNIARRNHAAFFQSGDTPRLWVLGGHSSAAGYGGDGPPYSPAEYYGLVKVSTRVYLPLALRDSGD